MRILYFRGTVRWYRPLGYRRRSIPYSPALRSILDGFFRRSWSEEELKKYREQLLEEPVLDESLFAGEIIPVPGLRFDAAAGDFVDA